MSDTPDSNPPAIGQLIRLDVTLRSSGLWLGPLWAVLCGIIASGRFTWNVRGVLLAVLTIFLVDGIWATLWAIASETNWAALAAHWNASPPPLRSHRLPCMRPDVPPNRAIRWLSQWGHWWQTRLQPVAGASGPGIVICLALGAALSTILGWRTLALSAAALAMIQTGLVINRAAGQPVPVVKAMLEVGLAWLAGHAAFGPPSLSSTWMAVTFTMAYAGGLQLVEQPRGLGNWRGAQLIAALSLLIVRQPVAALMLLLILFAQWLIEPALPDRGGAWFVRSSQAWLIAAMLTAAFAIR